MAQQTSTGFRLASGHRLLRHKGDRRSSMPANISCCLNFTSFSTIKPLKPQVYSRQEPKLCYAGVLKEIRLNEY